MEADSSPSVLNRLLATFGRIEADAARPGTVLSPDWTKGWLLMAFIWSASLASTIVLATPPLWQYMGDVLVLFDGGWRVYNGQVPHADFYSCLGPVPTGVLGLGFFLTGGHSPGLGFALGLCGVAFSLLGFIAAQGRLSRFWGLAFSLFVLVLVTAPAALGMKDVNTDLVSFRYSNTYAMFYNRLGWAAIVVAQLCVLMPRRGPESGFIQSESTDGFIAGLACTLAIFTKINFLAVGGLLIVIACLIPRPGGRTRFVTGMVVGLAATTLLLGIWPGGAWAYFQDTVTLLKVHRAESHLSSLFYKSAINAPWLLVLGVLTVSMLASARKIHGAAGRAGPASEIWGPARAAFIVMATGLFLTGFNFEGSAYPSLFLAGLFLIQLSQAGQSNGQAGSGDGSLRIVLIKSAVLAFLSVFLWFNAGSVAYGHLWKLKNRDWQNASGVLSGALTKSIPIPVRPTEKADRQSQKDSIKAGK
ncbi:MAG TPA: hypothetical protein VK968_19440, partial [Roseimicrobium sp.]|nr:hypothetical protein [Roseimicrobium sp.]